MDKEMYDQLEREKKTVETIVDYLFELKRTFPLGDIDDVFVAIKTGREFMMAIEVLQADLVLTREVEK